MKQILTCLSTAARTPWSPERVRGRRTSNIDRRSQPLHPFSCLGWKTNPTSPHLPAHQPTLCINCARCRRLAETTGPDPRIGTAATPRATAQAISLDAVRPSVHSWPICQVCILAYTLIPPLPTWPICQTAALNVPNRTTILNGPDTESL